MGNIDTILDFSVLCCLLQNHKDDPTTYNTLDGSGEAWGSWSPINYKTVGTVILFVLHFASILQILQPAVYLASTDFARLKANENAIKIFILFFS